MGQTPWSARVPLDPLPEFCAHHQQADEGVGRRPGGLPHLACIFLLLATAMCLQAADVQVESSERQARVAFHWASPTKCESSVDGRELLLRCSSPVEIGETEALVKKASIWLENFSAGFDTVLLQAARDVVYQVTPQENGLVVVISPAATSPDSAPAVTPDTAPKIRLELIRVQALAESGREAQALDLARGLAAEYPGDPKILVELASLETARNRPRRAWQLYERAQAADPGNQDLAESSAELARLRSPRVQLDYDYRTVETAQTEQISSLTARARVGGAFETGLNFASDVFSCESLAGVRTRGEAYLGYEAENGSTLRGSVFEGEGRAGAGFKFARPDDRGRTGGDITYRQPYWEFFETLNGGGVRDRIELWREQNLFPNLTARVAAGANRYGLTGMPQAASSLFVEATLSYRIMRRPNIAIEYGLDAEYRRVLTTLQDAEGHRSAPLPLVSREVHLASATVSHRIGRGIEAEGYAGLAVDRLGGKAPFFGGRLTVESKNPIGTQVFFDRRLFYLNTAQTDTRAGGYFYWRF